LPPDLFALIAGRPRGFLVFEVDRERFIVCLAGAAEGFESHLPALLGDAVRCIPNETSSNSNTTATTANK
jgi:hypothetical protein